MASCPSDSELSDFLDESLAPDKLAPLSAHIDDCTACQKRLDWLTHDADGPAARYKDLSTFRAEAGTRFSTPPTSGVNLGEKTLGLPRLSGLPCVRGFEVLREIGRGSVGVVYRALHQRLNRIVALKLIVADCAGDKRIVQRFLHEAEIAARTKHPQLVQIFELDTYEGPSGTAIPYMAMELLEGGSLVRLLRDQPSGKLEPETAAELIEGIARAVHCLHLKGIIHRSLKPKNILFPYLEPAERKGPSGQSNNVPLSSIQSNEGSSRFLVLPKVTDFAFASFVADATHELNLSIPLTRCYTAPEVIESKGQIGPAADVYSLGAILFECLSGQPPTEKPLDTQSLSRDVHPDLAAIITRCVVEDPDERYSSALELAEELRRYLNRRPTNARPVNFRDRVWLSLERNPAVAYAVVASLGVLLFAFLMLVLSG